MENRIISVERIKQFSNIPSEATWEIKDRVPPPSWPSRGNVELKDLQVITLSFFFLHLQYCKNVYDSKNMLLNQTKHFSPSEVLAAQKKRFNRIASKT